MKQRIAYFDIFRGIGIFLIVFGHGNWSNVGTWLHAFLMPLFFFVSGLLTDLKTPWTTLAVKRFRRIMVPYFVFALLSFAYWYFLERHFRPHVEELTPWLEFVNIFYPMNMRVPDAYAFNVVLWFLPCMFLATLMFDGIMRIGRTVYGQSALVLGVIAVNVWIPPTTAPFYLAQALAMLPYMFMGYLVSLGKDRLAGMVQSNGVLALAIAGSLHVLGYLTASVADVRLGVYTAGYLWYLIVGAILVLAVLAISMAVRHDRLFEWLGVNSMAIMLIHDPIKRIVIVLVAKAAGVPVESVRSSNLWCLVVAAVILGICAVLLFGYRQILARLRPRTKEVAR